LQEENYLKALLSFLSSGMSWVMSNIKTKTVRAIRTNMLSVFKGMPLMNKENIIPRHWNEKQKWSSILFQHLELARLHVIFFCWSLLFFSATSLSSGKDGAG
jgi:hypothetical protein